VTSRGGIESLLVLMDEAFRGAGIEASNESQALLPNLRSVPVEAWNTVPDGLARSIEAIAIHVGACKVMYDDYAFRRRACASRRPRSSRGGPASRR
jgi:hypothetical protein